MKEKGCRQAERRPISPSEQEVVGAGDTQIDSERLKAYNNLAASCRMFIRL
jgi:hypothetical protein